MIKFLRKNIVALGGSLLLVLGGYVYYVYFAADTGAALTSTEPSAISQDLLKTLSSLHTIRLDNSIFSDASFQSLSDFGVVIPAQNVGRQNPFLPLAGAPAGKK